MLRQFIPALMTDNPSLDHDYSGKLEGLGDPALVKAMRDGDWNIVAGGMFDDLWTPSVHIVRSFEIPYSWKINRGFDWGSSKPFSVLWFAESDGTDITYPDGVREVLITEFFPAFTRPPRLRKHPSNFYGLRKFFFILKPSVPKIV